jgi:hypothetical protein
MVRLDPILLYFASHAYYFFLKYFQFWLDIEVFLFLKLALSFNLIVDSMETLVLVGKVFDLGQQVYIAMSDLMLFLHVELDWS